MWSDVSQSSIRDPGEDELDLARHSVYIGRAVVKDAEIAQSQQSQWSPHDAAPPTREAIGLGRWDPIVVDNPVAPFPVRPPSTGPYRPDTVCDGWSVGTMTIRAASVRGYDHRSRGTVRQDDLVVAPTLEPAASSSPSPTAYRGPSVRTSGQVLPVTLRSTNSSGNWTRRAVRSTGSGYWVRCRPP